MSFVLVGVGVATGAAKIGMALSGRKKRIAEQKAAAKELEERKAAYENLDTSNPYLNMENTMEDLTVNTQQADFMAQQNQQNQANIMASMQGAAGGSGIAGLAQAMANQGALQAQQASASIGQQEQANQMAEAKMAGNIQMMERKGEVYSRAQEKDKVETLMGMAQQRKGAADAARQRAKDQVSAGIGSIGGALAGGLTKGITGGAGGNTGSFMGNLKQGTIWE
ncbi:hypothetical protein [Acinetobacter sp.]|uniref:hypothetical protein n=1 Tax=Acinetobacter sp. TaxID=472 RepID=UPI000C0B1BA0|nr:hypothetical protein [Acinetobacter sp.]MAK29841.1 hypothetical protein [Acinetobacter sp.]|tara:strand:- start:168 stop:839 length:672 start_codon:yes stop_codon:yes gene_type:complete